MIIKQIEEGCPLALKEGCIASFAANISVCEGLCCSGETSAAAPCADLVFHTELVKHLKLELIGQNRELIRLEGLVSFRFIHEAGVPLSMGVLCRLPHGQAYNKSR